MPAYTKTPRVNNIGLAPAIPVYRLALAERIAASVRRCRDKGKHLGRARRHRREVQTRQAALWLEGLRSGAERVSDGGGRTYSLGELLRGPLLDHPGWARSLQHQARNLVTLAERHGPASGWGLRQDRAGEVGNPKWTPYYVPKAAERCWRYWRVVCRALRRALRGLARVLSRGPSTPLAPTEPTRDGRDESREHRGAEKRLPVYRDHSAEPWAEAAEQLRLRLTT